MGRRGAARSHGGSRFLGLHFEFLWPFRAEGLAPFFLSRMLGRGFRPTSRAAEPRCARREPRRPRSPGYGPGDLGPADKDRPIDPTSGKNYVRLNKARTGFEPNGQADGRQPFMPANVSRTPVFETYPFGCADCEADAAAFRRAR